MHMAQLLFIKNHDGYLSPKVFMVPANCEAVELEQLLGAYVCVCVCVCVRVRELASI